VHTCRGSDLSHSLPHSIVKKVALDVRGMIRLEQARLKRLPSFSEQAALGITGHGIGLLRVWINAAAGLRYDAMSGLRGKPSACVKVKVGSKEQLTATASADSDPRWNSPVMTFEVESRANTLTLEVWDIVGSQQHFLGQGGGQTQTYHIFLPTSQAPVVSSYFPGGLLQTALL